MFVFDLFEKKEKEQQDTPSKFIRTKSTDARVKSAIDRAYRDIPSAKNDFEAMAGHIDKVDSINAQQSKELQQQEKENRQQAAQIKGLAQDNAEKEARFRELTNKIASQGDQATADQIAAAKAAQEIEKGHDIGQPVAPAAAIARAPVTKAPAQAVAKAPTQVEPTAVKQAPVSIPEPGASVTQLAQYAKQKAEPATATPQAKTASSTVASNEPEFDPDAADIFGLQKAAESKIQEQNDAGTLAFQRMAQTLDTAPAVTMDPKKQEQKLYNERQFKIAVVKGTNVQLQFGPARITLTGELASTMWEVILVRYGKTPEARAVFDKIFSDLNAYREMKNYIEEMQASLPIKEQPELSEGDVVPFTDQQIVNQAYADALAYLKYAYKSRENDPMRLTMRQDFAQKYRQRFEIKLHPDGKTYYLQDKQQGKTYRLPAPDFPMEEGRMKDLALKGLSVPGAKESFSVVKMVGPDIVPLKTYDTQEQAQLHAKNIKKKYPGMQIAVSDANGQLSMIGLSEDSWHDGQNAWSSEHDQWAKENKEFGRVAFAKAADQREKERKEFEKSIAHLPWEERMRLIRARIEKNLSEGNVNYWHKLQEERRKKAYSLLDELDKVLDNYEIK